MPTPMISPEARGDLQAISDHISLEDPDAAERVVDALLRRCETLAAFPQLGRLRPEFAPDIRSFAVGNYVIFYSPVRDTVEVLHVYHGGRDINALFEDAD